MTINKVLELIKLEEKRQQETLMMIPSENYTYPEVRTAVGSVLMHKYAEGYPKRRYYQGNSVVDEIEDYCRQKALEAFRLDPEKYHANVQPHSGCEANLGVYNALLNPGDKILSMFLPDGGHLSHGWKWKEEKTTFVSKVFQTEFYHVDPTTRLFNYDQIEKQARQYRPKLIISGGTAYPREIDYKRMGKIAKSVGAYYLADIAHEAGLIAAGVCDSPFEYADMVSMTTHKTLRGPRGAIIICKKEFEKQLDLAIMPGLQGGPHIHTIAGIAIALENTMTPEFKKYAQEVVDNAKALAEELKGLGLDVVSDGTDKHLVLIDLRNVGTNGWLVAWALDKVGIIINRNTVPNESSSPFYPSGIRLGTPAVTVRGMGTLEMKQIAEIIIQVVNHVKGNVIPEDKEERVVFTKKYLHDLSDDEFINRLSKEVSVLTKKYPINF